MKVKISYALSILTVISWFIFPVVGIVTGIAAVILAILSKSKTCILSAAGCLAFHVIWWGYNIFSYVNV